MQSEPIPARLTLTTSLRGYNDGMNHDPRDLEWQRRYEQDDTPWDKGAPAPALVTFLREKQIAGRVLVPGCGRGHEAVSYTHLDVYKRQPSRAACARDRN